MVVSREAKKKQYVRESSGLCDHYSELFTRMAALKFVIRLQICLFLFGNFANNILCWDKSLTCFNFVAMTNATIAVLII